MDSQASPVKNQKKSKHLTKKSTTKNTTSFFRLTKKSLLSRSEKLLEKKRSKCIQIKEEIPKNSNNYRMLMKSFPTQKKGNFMMIMERKELRMEVLQEVLVLEAYLICLLEERKNQQAREKANQNLLNSQSLWKKFSMAP